MPDPRYAASATSVHRAMLEDELLGNVIEVAHLFGWSVAHFRPALTKRGWRTPVSADGKGFPDLVLVHRGKQPTYQEGVVLWRELKRETGKPSPEQQVWIELLEAAGEDVGIWRPSDWTSGRIERELRSP